MKKKLLFCIHNYFYLKHYIVDLKKLRKDYEVTILTTNYLVKNSKFEKNYILQEIKIENIFFIPFYQRGLERPMSTILSTHLYLLKLKQQINFNEFDICVTDSKFFIWQRIILEKYVSKKCKKIGIMTGSIALDLSVFKKLILGENIENFINKLHKLRQYNPEKRVPEKNFFKKIFNIKKRFLDIFFDRKILSYLFQSQNFDYKEKDFKILETDDFDYKVLFHYSNFIFWRKIYKKKENVIFAKHANNCKCNNSQKNKFLFLSSMLWGRNKEEISEQIKSIINFFKTKNNDSSNKVEIHIKHHPEESDQIIENINRELKKNITEKIKIVFVDKSKLLNDIACDYSIAFGMMSTALVDVKNACKFIKVYCLKSLSIKEYGNEYFLKLFNENINFYDDIKDLPDENLQKYQRYIQNYDKIDFSDFLKKFN